MQEPINPSRDLFFGLLALQTGLIDEGALLTAFTAWTRDKTRSLADHLVALCHLDAARRAAVEAIAAVHIQALGGDIEKAWRCWPWDGRRARASCVPAARTSRRRLVGPARRIRRPVPILTNPTAPQAFRWARPPPIEVGGHVRWQELDRRLALEPSVFGQKYLSHAAGTELGRYTILADRLADHVSFLRGAERWKIGPES
jgi:hypothetical protein